jgi:hypothetical protein
MSEETVRRRDSRTLARSPRRFRSGAAIVVLVAVGLILWLALRNTGSGSPATAVSVGQLRTLATSVGHPVFWVGPRKGYTYELKRKSDGSIYVRYLPAGVQVGAKEQYLTVATYPFTGAFKAIQRVLRQGGSAPIRLAHGGLAEFSNTKPNNVHAAYPGIDYQVEVFDPTGKAVAIVRAGQLTSFGGPKGAPPPRPTAASLAGLKSLAGSLGHPIYWAGPRRGYTYELTREPGGKIYIRYLPPGVNVGAKQQYLTVATYPFPGALAAIQRVAKRQGQVTIPLAGGGLAVFGAKNPGDVHLAYPGSNYQVEVFDPPARARFVVVSGRITSIG